MHRPTCLPVRPAAGVFRRRRRYRPPGRRCASLRTQTQARARSISPFRLWADGDRSHWARSALMRLPEMTTVILALAVAPSCAGAAGPTLLLALQVNGYATGKIGEFSLLDGALAARRGELRDLGFRVPEAAPSAPGASSDG